MDAAVAAGGAGPPVEDGVGAVLSWSEPPALLVSMSVEADDVSPSRQRYRDMSSVTTGVSARTRTFSPRATTPTLHPAGPTARSRRRGSRITGTPTAR